MLTYASLAPDGSLQIAIPSPCHEGDRLTIIADPDFDEVSIGFGFAHSHGGRWDEEAAADHGFASSIRLIHDVLEERVVSCKYAGYGRLGRLEQLRALEDWGSVTAVRSWRGSHDRG